MNRVVENPPVTLDFVYSRDIEIAGGEYEISAKVGNIFGDDYEALQVISDNNDEAVVFDTYEIGRTLSIGLTRRF